MFRVVSVLVFVSACAPAVSGARTELSGAPSPRREAVKTPLEATDAPRPRASRLAPPFGRSAGVRRVANTDDGASSAPAIVAAAEPRD